MNNYKSKKEICESITKLDISDSYKWQIMTNLEYIHSKFRIPYKSFSNLRIEEKKVIITYKPIEESIIKVTDLLNPILMDYTLLIID